MAKVWRPIPEESIVPLRSQPGSESEAALITRDGGGNLCIAFSTEAKVARLAIGIVGQLEEGTGWVIYPTNNVRLCQLVDE